MDYILYKHASNADWGASDSDHTINGRWSETEKTLHINCVELLAVKFAVKSFSKNEVFH